jgi:tetratricopeptide (TPR) repeat protein
VKFAPQLNPFLILLTVAGLWGCSNKKDGTSYRVYHNMTAHYNGYFNADELVAKGEKTIRASHKDDYDKLLPIFIYGTEEDAQPTFPDLEKAIAKCEKVINKHTIKDDSKKNKKKPELNKWIDENYMVVGRAHFYKRSYYKAADIFQYVNRKFKKPEVSVLSNSWLARTYIQQEEYSKAVQSLVKSENDAESEDVSEKIKADYHLVYADAFIHQKKLEKAAEQLEKAIGYIHRKKDRARPNYILAQIYQELRRSSDAITAYETVIRSHAPYELEFHARINKALSYSRTGGSSEQITKELMKMLRDEKNYDYRDQIYYALGDIAWEEQRRPDAIYFYEQSIRSNTTNERQKAKAFLRLADLYFDERQYANAQKYYDSTLTTIQAEHERFAIVKARAESLTELVASLNAIELFDSLSVICALSPKEQEKKLEEIAKQMANEKEQERLEDERRAAEAKKTSEQTGITGTFWCYNENLKKKGKANFDDEWGGRPLKDYWRLQSKLAESFEPGEENDGALVDPGTDTTATATNDKYKAPSADELKADLPCDSAAQMNEIKSSAAEGYYNAGVIYKEKLDDDDNAISTWEELLANMDDSDYHPTTYYQLFRTWMAKEGSKGYVKNPFCSTCNSQYWGDEIKSRYPGSDWAMLVDNPAFLDVQDMKNAKESEAYQEAYVMYASRNYASAKTYCDSIISKEPENHLLCKYRLLRAVCVGYSDAMYGVKQNYQNELNQLVQTCGGTEEANRAQELLNALIKGDNSQTLETNKTDESTGQNQTAPQDSALVVNNPVAEDGPYKYDANAEHYFAIILPVKNSDVNKAKTAVSDFNNLFFTSAQLKVTNNLLDKDNHLVLIKSFKKTEDSGNYVRAFQSDTDKLGEINNASYRTFLISKQNYIALFKNKDLEQYMDFYMRYYQQP